MEQTTDTDPIADVSSIEVRAAAGEQTENPAPGPLVPWLQATAADAGDRDFEAPIAGFVSADSFGLSEQYRRAGQPPEAGAAPPDAAEVRLFAMLSAITGMHLKAHEREEPFGPFMTLADGRRTAIPEDFRNGHIDLLAGMAVRSANPVLKARLADICWLLDRRRSALGSVAITAYVDTIECVEAGSLKFSITSNRGELEHNACELLRRALYIGRTIGWDKSESVQARDAVVRLRDRAIGLRAAVAAVWFAELDLDFGVSDPVTVAEGIEEVLASPVDADVHLIASLWRLAARGYHVAKRDDDKHRCQTRAAEATAAEAERILAGEGQRPGSAMLASHLMSNAIAQLHGIPATKDRRTKLRHRLVDIQAGISEEMSVFSHQWDISGIESEVQERLREGSLFDQLFIFAAVGNSPDPEELVAKAQESIRLHPLHSLFPAVHFDREGKFAHRSAAAGFPGDPAESAIRREIAQSESIRRNLIGAAIEIARRTIMARYFLPEEMLASVLQQSPFVPSALVATFSRGFLRFFQGDFASATYILTPLLENSLRHVLKLNGHDVTIFDDATQTQRDRTISQLFEQMREELDAAFTKPITSDIENVFLNQPGPHLRHDVAHGLAHDGTPYGPDAVYGCWLIYRLCLLPLFPYREQMRKRVHLLS
jgi:hypothetical protein